MISFQYTYDADGKPIGVFVPINEWEKISNELLKVKKHKRKEKLTLLDSIKKGMNQVSKIEKKKIKSIPLQQLLDDL
ncbi:MAG TPA: hypothetical protein VH396_20285 [Chitinophagaceae bacterium]|jgi:hypothetical protein